MLFDAFPGVLRRGARALYGTFVVVFLIVGCAAAPVPDGPVGQAEVAPQAAGPRNVILLITDGAGPASFTMARDYVRATAGRETLVADGTLTGSVRTYATDSRVTDSAAGATAFATGVKTYNGAIAVDTLERPLTTLLERAEAHGMVTGLVATTRITHATPAAFSAHVPSRNMEEEIAVQQLGKGIDVLFGGGRDYFVPREAGGLREDGRDLLAEAREGGYQVVTTRAGFDGELRTPVLGLFNSSSLNYEIDRDPQVEPSLAELSVRAIELLSAHEGGFFLMIEASRIDHAGHDNDAAAHVRDMVAFDETFAAVLDFAAREGNTLVVSVSDHETGGISLGRSVDDASVYHWQPEVLAGVTASLAVMVSRVREGAAAADVLAQYAGIDDLTPTEVAILDRGARGDISMRDALSDVISRRAIVGWTTTGHTAVDVNLYAFGPGRDAFIGHFDNTHIGRAIARLLRLDGVGQVSAVPGTVSQ